MGFFELWTVEFDPFSSKNVFFADTIICANELSVMLGSVPR